ncbi:UPF0415 protein C7orf25 homolog [Lampetra planeri]
MSTAARLEELLVLGHDLLRRTEELGIKSEPHLPDRFTGSVQTKSGPLSRDEVSPLLGSEPGPQNNEEVQRRLETEPGTGRNEKVPGPPETEPGPQQQHEVPNPLVTEPGTPSVDQVPSPPVPKLGTRGRPSGLAMLRSKIEAEMRFLMRVQGGQCRESHVRSSNLTQLRALLQAAEAHGSVTAVLKTFRYRDELEQPRVLLVDVVAEGGRAWVKAVGRKADSLLAAWAGRCPHGVRCVSEQANLFLRAAQHNPLHFHAPRVVFSFYGGVPSPVACRLQEMGVTVRGDILPGVTDPLSGAIGGGEEEEERGGDSDSDDEGEGGDSWAPWGDARAGARLVTASPPSSPVWTQPPAGGVGGGGGCCCSRVNLDVTTMLTLVSALSHGGSHFAFKEQVLAEQAAEERTDPVLPALVHFLHDKLLVACDSAARDFSSILGTLGGPRERARARGLMGRVAVVADGPSARALGLAVRGRVTPRSVAVFGTGDELRAVTATANAGLVRAAAQQGVAFAVFLHRPRALTEGKERDAARLPSARRRDDGREEQEAEEELWREFTAGKVGQQQD